MLSFSDFDLVEPAGPEQDQRTFEHMLGPQFCFKTLLGAGTFGAVYLGFDNDRKISIAIKV